MEGCRTSVSWQKGLSGTWYCSAFLSKVKTSSSLSWAGWCHQQKDLHMFLLRLEDCGSQCSSMKRAGNLAISTMLAMPSTACNDIQKPNLLLEHFIKQCELTHGLEQKKNSQNSKDYFSKYGLKHKVTFLAISVFPLMRQTHTAIKQQSLLLGWIWATKRKPLAHL